MGWWNLSKSLNLAGGSFLGQILIKVLPNKVKRKEGGGGGWGSWGFVQKWNLTLPSPDWFQCKGEVVCSFFCKTGVLLSQRYDQRILKITEKKKQNLTIFVRQNLTLTTSGCLFRFWSLYFFFLFPLYFKSRKYINVYGYSFLFLLTACVNHKDIIFLK